MFSRQVSLVLGVVLIVLLVWAAFMLDVRYDQPTIQLTQEWRAMVEWRHLAETGGILHITVLRSDYPTDAEYRAAIDEMMAKYPPNIPPQ